MEAHLRCPHTMLKRIDIVEHQITHLLNTTLASRTVLYTIIQIMTVVINRSRHVTFFDWSVVE